MSRKAVRKVLYKYYFPDRLDLFDNWSVRFSNPAHFNDRSISSSISSISSIISSSISSISSILNSHDVGPAVILPVLSILLDAGI